MDKTPNNSYDVFNHWHDRTNKLMDSNTMLPTNKLHDYIEKNFIDYYIDNGETIDDYCEYEINALIKSFNKLAFDINDIHAFCMWADYSRSYDAGWLGERSESEFDKCRDKYLKLIGLIK